MALVAERAPARLVTAWATTTKINISTRMHISLLKAGLCPFICQRLFIFLLCHILSLLPVGAQHIVNISLAANAPRPGDVLTRHLVAPIDMLSDSTDLWSFYGNSVDDHDFRQSVFSLSTPDSICFLEQGTCQSYKLYGDTLFYNGFENSQIKISYDLPEKRMLYPMVPGSQLQGFFHGTGTFCDKYFLHTFGRYHTCASQCGSLVTVRGDTLRHVLKLHVTRWVSNVYYPQDSVRNLTRFSFMNYPSDSIIVYQKNDSTLLKEEIVYLYSHGFRYPIVEYRQTEGGGQRLAACYYACPDEQTGMALDEENDLSFGVEFLDKSVPVNDKTDISYTLSNDRSTRRLIIAYRPSYSGDLRLLLSDTLGRVLQSENYPVTEGREGEVGISYAALHRGQYVLYVCSPSGRKVEKFSIE